ncbi:MAG: chloride channel protein, partial [Polyangiales bacterium]
AVFAAASNAPIALAIMAAELLGGGVLPHAMLVCVVAYYVSGHRTIYGSQRVGASKWGHAHDDPTTKVSDVGRSSFPGPPTHP